MKPEHIAVLATVVWGLAFTLARTQPEHSYIRLAFDIVGSVSLYVGVVALLVAGDPFSK